MIGRIENTYLRRAAMIAWLPLAPFIALGHGLAKSWELLTELPDAVCICWSAR